ncbi:MAG: hypothetical protein PHT60_14030 [Acidiphilium sp.]|nr:hypothetical protein [Acidiphilium sp.]MDD4936884.1 hypothetical protein [Acidiphilium sp.]
MSASPETIHCDAPSQPSGAEPERYRFFSVKLHRLISYREDGAVYVREVGSDWVRTRAPAATVAIRVERFARAARAITNLPAWAQTITDLPSMAEIERWVSDSVVEATDGEDVEPDGHSPDGAPSWLLALGMI